jgi:hypothetical protein
MNYIHKLQGEVQEKDREVQAIRESLIDLRNYLLSGKFRCGNDLDGYVNVQDVLNRLPQ